MGYRTRMIRNVTMNHVVHVRDRTQVQPQDGGWLLVARRREQFSPLAALGPKANERGKIMKKKEVK